MSVMKFSNSYHQLGEAFYQRIEPTPVQDPSLFLWNSKLAQQLQLDSELVEDKATLAQVFSGNQSLKGAEPIAMAYAGHQFGNFVPQLGDGRAHLIGEVLDAKGKGWDIQLKGSGPTYFSRGGDGRCALGPAIREFLMSEAMQALGVPTTRCLAVVTTGEPVYRETPLPGAVVTRVASSHLRVGTFQFFAKRGDFKSLSTLVDYAIQRHYPEINLESELKYIELLDSVIARQIKLVVEWMRVGFIHGVMNTDNTAISGETIDYGPCAMMEFYDPKTVFSSIDRNGRYAFGNQASIAAWNMARFAECLLPLMGDDPEGAVAQVQPLFDSFNQRFQQAYTNMMRSKLGLQQVQQGDAELLNQLLDKMQSQKMDYTQTFERLTRCLSCDNTAKGLASDLGDWFEIWQQRMQAESAPQARELMQRCNPVVIPRNHHMEAVLQTCIEKGTPDTALEFLKVIRQPYTVLPETHKYQDPASDGDIHYKTFCGT